MRKNEIKYITEIWREVRNGKYILQKSDEPKAWGIICFEGDDDMIAITSYATFNSPIHNLTVSPGEVLCCFDKKWAMSRNLDGIELKANSEKDVLGNKILVETKYCVLIGYGGADYKRRVIIFQGETKEILEISMNYEDGKRDVGRFEYLKDENDNKIIKINWICEYGPIGINILKAA